MAASVILVHGNHHGAWSWDKIVERLAARGIATIAVDLPGRGANKDIPKGIVNSLRVVEQAIEAAGGPVILCGHSAGGIPITFAAGHPNVCGLIYIAAIVPALAELMESILEEVFKTVSPRLKIEGDEVSYDNFDAAFDLMYHDCDPEEARNAYERLLPELIKGANDDAVPELPMGAWREVHKIYAVCAEDHSIPAQCQRQLAERLDETVEWPTSHSPFMSRPDLVADLLERVAHETA